ncbi:hypothetical protein BC827DRAFT_425872 [Russula dissimulans]|nr:hypothetical protein BC827DRAFT_425872 [Russula dissimulans]
MYNPAPRAALGRDHCTLLFSSSFSHSVDCNDGSENLHDQLFSSISPPYRMIIEPIENLTHILAPTLHDSEKLRRTQLAATAKSPCFLLFAMTTWPHEPRSESSPTLVRHISVDAADPRITKKHSFDYQTLGLFFKRTGIQKRFRRPSPGHLAQMFTTMLAAQ